MLLVHKLFSAVPSAARGIKARVVCVFEIRSRCLHWEPWHWQQLRPGYASLVRAPSNAAFAMNPPLYGNSFQFISSLRSCCVTFSYLRLINIKFTLESLLSKGGIPTQINWEENSYWFYRDCYNFLYSSTLCVTGYFILDALLVFFLVIFFQYFSDFWVPLYNLSSFFAVYSSFPLCISNPFHYVKSLWRIPDIVTETVFTKM